MELVMTLAVVLAGTGAAGLGACLWVEDRSRKAVAADRAKRMGYRQR